MYREFHHPKWRSYFSEGWLNQPDKDLGDHGTRKNRGVVENMKGMWSLIWPIIIDLLQGKEQCELGKQVVAVKWSLGVPMEMMGMTVWPAGIGFSTRRRRTYIPDGPNDLTHSPNRCPKFVIKLYQTPVFFACSFFPNIFSEPIEPSIHSNPWTSHKPNDMIISWNNKHTHTHHSSQMSSL